MWMMCYELEGESSTKTNNRIIKLRNCDRLSIQSFYPRLYAALPHTKDYFPVTSPIVSTPIVEKPSVEQTLPFI